MRLKREKKYTIDNILTSKTVKYLLFVFSVVSLITFPVLWLLVIIPYLIYIIIKHPIRPLTISKRIRHVMSYISFTAFLFFIIVILILSKSSVMEAYQKKPENKNFYEYLIQDMDKNRMEDEFSNSKVRADITIKEKNSLAKYDTENNDFKVEYLPNLKKQNSSIGNKQNKNKKNKQKNDSNEVKNKKWDDFKSLIEDFTSKNKQNKLTQRSVPKKNTRYK